MKIPRRDALRAFQALFGATLIGCGQRPSGAASTSSASGAAASAPSTGSGSAEAGGAADVIVLGAGVSGLGAAHALKKGGKRVIVVEARDRIGGRLHTHRGFARTPIELGASWIHGHEGNPVTAIAKEIGAETAITTWENVAIYDEGTRLSKGDARHTRRVFEKVSGAIDGPKDRSVQEAFDAAADELELSTRDRLELAWVLAAEIESDFACDAADLSMRGWEEGRSDRGEDVLLTQGYDQIFKVLADGVDVRLGHVASSVSHDDGGVRVKTSKGEFTAKRAIVTLPLGVLRAGSVRFDPALPEEKTAAISAMKMDVLQKIHLRYKEPFWPEDVEIFGRLARGGEFVSAVNVAKWSKEPVLLFFNSGSVARRIEEMTDAAIAELATKHLREMFGSGVPAPEACMASRWGKDPFALGSYSHLAVGAKASDRKRLAEPVSDRVFFAGEATESDYPATIHGALLSGRREAARVLALG